MAADDELSSGGGISPLAGINTPRLAVLLKGWLTRAT